MRLIDYMTGIEHLPIEKQLDRARKQDLHFARFSKSKECKAMTQEDKINMLHAWQGAKKLRARFYIGMEYLKDISHLQN